MKASEARAIVAKMIHWSMLAQGIPIDNPEPITEDLATLLKANQIVCALNKKALSNKNGTRTYAMTIADRGIAALYVAANFVGDQPTKIDILAMHGDNVVVCLNKVAIEEESNDEQN